MVDIKRKTVDALVSLGLTLPDNSSIELCVVSDAGRPVCHRFSVRGGAVHHSESHSHDFVQSGQGNLSSVSLESPGGTGPLPEDRGRIRWSE